MSKLIPTRWLPSDGVGYVFPDMAQGYECDDYPGLKIGSGRVADLYTGMSHVSSARPYWVAQIWTNDKDGCDVIFNEKTMSSSEYMRAVLFVRLYHDDKKASPSEAFDFIVNDFRATARNVSDLTSVTGEEGSGDTITRKRELPA